MDRIGTTELSEIQGRGVADAKAYDSTICVEVDYRHKNCCTEGN
jgi:hypothetical protein